MNYSANYSIWILLCVASFPLNNDNTYSTSRQTTSFLGNHRQRNFLVHWQRWTWTLIAIQLFYPIFLQWMLHSHQIFTICTNIFNSVSHCQQWKTVQVSLELSLDEFFLNGRWMILITMFYLKVLFVICKTNWFYIFGSIVNS